VAPCHDLEGNLLKLPNTTMTPLLLMIIWTLLELYFCLWQSFLTAYTYY
jgi:hypothetical protein